MKRPEIRDKCARIRSRIAGNTCLGQSVRMRGTTYNADFFDSRRRRRCTFSLANFRSIICRDVFGLAAAISPVLRPLLYRFLRHVISLKNNFLLLFSRKMSKHYNKLPCSLPF